MPLAIDILNMIMDIDNLSDWEVEFMIYLLSLLKRIIKKEYQGDQLTISR